MTKTIHQTVTLKAPPEELFRTYLDPRRHAAVTGDKVSISRKVGATFTAFGGMLTGKNLLIVPNRLIVQAWRAKFWKKNDLDSILILFFAQIRGGSKISLVHVNVPGYDYAGVKMGWPKYYWTPWKRYLNRRRAR